jgi:hypothetical protein
MLLLRLSNVVDGQIKLKHDGVEYITSDIEAGWTWPE